ncbi:MAG: hypothetical protein KAZ71_06095 [Bacteroidia bacterium]|nr:hypothetical protein [Bacteroidia bacterium]
MKLKLLILAILSSFIVLSQTQTVKLDNVSFVKTSSGYLVFGNTGDNYTLTKYDNQLVKLKEYNKNLKAFKSKVPAIKRYPNYIQLVFFTKIFPAKGIIARLDTNLNLIEEKEFGSSDFDNLKKAGTGFGDIFYPSYGFEDERTLVSHYTYYDDKIAIFDFKNKKIVFGKHNNSSPITYYDKINVNDLGCAGEISIGSCGFTYLNGRLFFYIKSKTDEINTKMNALGGRRSASIGELVVGEIDTKKNTIRYATKISNINVDYDFSLDKLFYDSSADKLVVAGTYLDNASFENSKAKEGSEGTGWYIVTLDATGKIGPPTLTKNDNRIFENVKEKLQSNRQITIKSIEKNSDGYILIAELDSKFFRSSTYEELNTKTTTTTTLFQPYGFYRLTLNETMELKNSEFYPAKVWHKIKFEEIENANFVRSGECRSQAYFISGNSQSTVVYSYGKNIILCKAGKEYSFIQELLSADIEVRADDMSLIRNNDALMNMFAENSIKKANTTWFFPLDDKKYCLIEWKEKELVFKFLSY